MRRNEADLTSITPGDGGWARLSLAIRRRYRRLIAYHIRRVRRWYPEPEMGEEDLAQEVEAAIWTALCTWRVRRATHMQFSTYLHWQLSKRLARLRPAAASRPAPPDQPVLD